MQFRFEGRKQDNGFHFSEYPDTLTIIHESEFDDDTRWDNVMLQFAKFLDACGYVGVYEKVQQRVDQDWEAVTKGFNDEDFSHTGLSD